MEDSSRPEGDGVAAVIAAPTAAVADGRTTNAKRSRWSSTDEHQPGASSYAAAVRRDSGEWRNPKRNRWSEVAKQPPPPTVVAQPPKDGSAVASYAAVAAAAASTARSSTSPTLQPMDTDQLFPKLDASDPDKARRMFQRQKDVSRGKNTACYHEYVRRVPKDQRRPRSLETPSTPDASLDIPTRKWQGLLRAWCVFPIEENLVCRIHISCDTFILTAIKFLSSSSSSLLCIVPAKRAGAWRCTGTTLRTS